MKEYRMIYVSYCGTFLWPGGWFSIEDDDLHFFQAAATGWLYDVETR